MIKKIILAAFCLSLSVMYFFGISYSSDRDPVEAVAECNGQLSEKYPSVEAIKKQFGDKAKWQETNEPSRHDDNLTLNLSSMEYPGVKISTLGYTSTEHGDNFFLTLVEVKKPGFVDFLGIDIGSTREDVIQKFGTPPQVDGNKHIYSDDAGYADITFTIEKNRVVEMKYDNPGD